MVKELKIKTEVENRAKAIPLKINMADDKKDVVVEPVVEIDPITAKDEQIAKLTEERDNYKHVALKRLGKLPGDSDFVANADEKTGLTVEEQVRKTLIDNELKKAQDEKEAEAHKLVKENAELRLALKNRPGGSIGNGGSGETTVVKDNILSEQQIATIRSKGEKLKLSGEKLDAFVEKAKVNLLKNR